MAEFNIAYLYPDLMDLYGDSGNLIIIKKRLEWYGHKANIITVNLGDDTSFVEYDMLFMGAGIERNQIIVGEELQKRADSLKRNIEKGLPMLFIATAFQLLGTSYTTNTGEKISGLSLFNFYSENKSERLTGNTLITTDINDKEVNVVGFANHLGRTYIVDDNILPFGQVVKGYGNNEVDKSEGIRYKKLIGTYLHGPVLSKNPSLADFFINKMMERKNVVNNIVLNDKLELFAHKQVRDKGTGSLSHA